MRRFRWIFDALSSKLLFGLLLGVFILCRWQFAPNNAEMWITTTIQIGVAYLVLQIVHHFNFIKTTTFLPALLYLLFVSINRLSYSDLYGSVVSACVAISFFLLFISFQNSRAEAQSFNIAFLLTLGSLLWQPLLFCIPFFWYGFYLIKSWGWRIIPASIMGLAAVYAIIFGISVYKNNIEIFTDLLPDTEILFLFQQPELSLYEWIIFGFATVVFLISGFSLYTTGISENIRTLYSLQSIYLTGLMILILFIVQTSYKPFWLQIWFIPASTVVSAFVYRRNQS